MSEVSREIRLRIRLEVGARVPALVPRLVVACLGALLCLDRFPWGFWQVVGFMLAGFAALIPAQLYAWALILVLAASQYVGQLAAGDWHFHLLLAGLHLLHVMAALTVVLPCRGWMQVAVFRRPLVRFMAIQAPVQVIAFVALSWLAPGPDSQPRFSAPALGIVGAAALLALALILIVPLLQERPRNS